MDRAQLSAAELAEEIAREKDAARAPSSGAEVGAVRVPTRTRTRTRIRSRSDPGPPRASSTTTGDSRDPSILRTLLLPAADGSVVVEDESADESDESPDEDELERAAIVAGASRWLDITAVFTIAASVGHQHEPLDYGPKASETL